MVLRSLHSCYIDIATFPKIISRPKDRPLCVKFNLSLKIGLGRNRRMLFIKWEDGDKICFL